jgi:hypothetical protein
VPTRVVAANIKSAASAVAGSATSPRVHANPLALMVERHPALVPAVSTTVVFRSIVT